MMPNELYPDLWDEFEAIKAELVPEHANVDVMVDGGFCISPRKGALRALTGSLASQNS